MSLSSHPIQSSDHAPRESIFRLQGPDARLFLQGQTTADFQQAAVGEHRFAAFCNPKGRILADVLAVVVAEDTILLRGRTGVMEQLIAHLKPYLAFSKSELTTTDWTARCGNALSDHRSEPVQQQSAAADGALTLITIDRGEGLTEYWQQGSSKTSLDIEYEIPLAVVDFETARARVETTTIGIYLPQDLNYDLNETVSFTKGCYTGQEIVARLHYRGTPKRRLYRATAAHTATKPAAGDAITNAAGQRIGSVVNLLELDEQLGLLIEIVPANASDTLWVREGDMALSSPEACHSTTDQSTG